MQTEQAVYAALHRQQEARRMSSSGGAFTAITDSWFEKNGDQAVVYGCGMNEDLKAVHMRADRPEKRDKMRGSKYIGSDTSGVMRAVLQDLKQGKKVLFSGTPCQIGGLKSLLAMKNVETEDRLLTIEVICHGVGSVTFFQDYIQKLEKKYKSKAVWCTFRGKTRPGKHQQIVVRLANGRTHESPSVRQDGFYSAYVSNYILRPSCFHCPYAQSQRIADISLADFWGDTKGLADTRSLIFVHTPLGKKCVEASADWLEQEPIDPERVHQPNMHAPSQKPRDYEQFWETYDQGGYQRAQVYLGNDTLKGKIKQLAAGLVYRLYLVELLRKIKRMIKA